MLRQLLWSTAKKAKIATDVPVSKYLEVKGSRMHYVESGTGKPILLVHGMPSSSYLWRNIIPHLSAYGRCIAVDLIGHGQSDSPDIEFRIKNHLDYLTQFIEQLDLQDMLIIGHSWGATLGIAYAKTHATKVRGLSYFEPMLGTWDKWEDFNPQNSPAQTLFKQFRSEDGWDLIVNQNIFLEQVFVNASLRKLSDDEKEGYIAPFRSINRRIAAWRAPRELPIEGSPQDVVEMVEDNLRWLKQTDIPQLFFYTDPSAFFTTEKAKQFAKVAKNVTLYYLGKGVYNHAEDYPDDIGSLTARWFTGNYTLGIEKPKFSLYTNIHKVIRKEIAETSILAGSTDFFNKKESEIFYKKFYDLLKLLRSHSMHEDTFIHPLLIEKKLIEIEVLNKEHQELEEQLQSLEQLFLQIIESPYELGYLERGNDFYLAFNRFEADYLQHLNFEETEIMPTLIENFDITRLYSVMDKFKKSQSKEESLQSLSLMLCAITPAEALFVLSNIKNSTPKPVFLEIYQLAKQVMPKHNWERVDASLCLQFSEETVSQPNLIANLVPPADTVTKKMGSN